MNKHLLMLMMASAAIASQGAEKKAPQFLSNYVLQAVSPNGQWTVSELYGNVTLINIATGAETAFKADETGTKNYTVGTGNALSNDGLLICSSGSTSYGEYYEDGEWKQLKVGTAKNSNSFPNGVTPDGKRICGNIGLHETSFDDVTMCVPAIWDRQADGTFGDYVLLPHPNDDYFGRAPQYIKAIAISDDGHTVVGQITDCRGFLAYPIVYTENAKGEWSYSLPTAGTFNPNNVAIPEYPGESPNPPQAENYMTADQIAAYNEARNAWAASGYQQDLYPEYVDYMSADKRAQYEADEAKYKDHCDLCILLLKNVIFPSDALAEGMENKSVYWNDDLAVMGTFTLKTIKQMANAGDGSVEVLPVYKNDDDANFGPDLFLGAINNREEYRSY
ncbi:MAG: hypothetical protein K2O10_05410, partial [Muribaculaceae bacterium]|nr:hypothetical protein [Muribaculaceae bacterium]